MPALKLLTARAASAALGVTERRVRALIEAGALPATRLGRTWVIRPDDLRAVRTRKPGRPPAWRVTVMFRPRVAAATRLAALQALRDALGSRGRLRTVGRAVSVRTTVAALSSRKAIERGVHRVTAAWREASLKFGDVGRASASPVGDPPGRTTRRAIVHF